ncbi:hypothetical protein LEN26_004233 [Aphanomyces euteiches]|nr:hypothetical protein AeMF1_012767 [Aphanomyces euteiches]KAH9149589.1 hypothetical protein LEN26_004233 [Aphanomyces euteiches]KAH9192041.1 hypothetical protein AeNC1_005986 [Aphanomyces euteiches]
MTSATTETLPSSSSRTSHPRRNRPGAKSRRKQKTDATKIQVPTDDDLQSKLAAMKLSPSSSASTSSASSLTDSETKKNKKKQTNNQVDDDIDERPLNASEMSLWNALVAGTPIPEPTSPEKTQQKTTKKNKTTSDPNDKRDFLFGGVAPELRIQLQLDEVAQYSVTDMKTAARISHFLMSLAGVSPDSVITDGTACVGGNTSSFCTYFRYVQAIEIDATRFQMLVHNLHTVLSFVNIQCFCANYVEVAQCFRQDVVFIDPPWGGPEYRSRSTVDLYLGDWPLSTVCELLVGRTQYVVIKVPDNFDLDGFTANVSGTVGFVASFRKMGLVVVDYRFVTPIIPIHD